MEVSAPMDMPEMDGSKNIQHRKIRAELAENYWICRIPIVHENVGDSRVMGTTSREADHLFE